MRYIVIAAVFCFLTGPVEAKTRPGQVVTAKAKKHKVKGRKAPKRSKVRRTAAN